MRRRQDGFTLAELLVSMAVLSLIVLVVSRMVNSAATVTALSSKRMDADSQIRPVFDRMAIDFAQMIKRVDADYYVKSPLDAEPGNDRLAFFFNGPGYYPSTTAPVTNQSSVSLVAYRINSGTNRLERMAKGLFWNGVSTANIPMVFGLQAIANNWPTATSSSAVDADYEVLGPQIFRFEYFYLLKTGVISNLPGASGMADVSAICVTFAAIDPRSRILISDSQLNTLGGRLKDFDPASPNYDLTTSWQSTLNSVNDMPRNGVNGVRIYQRYFSLTP